MKKLYKSNNRMICGVCAGLAEYLGIDPTVVRLIWAALGLTGTGIVLYIIAALVRPETMDGMYPGAISICPRAQRHPALRAGFYLLFCLYRQNCL